MQRTTLFLTRLGLAGVLFVTTQIAWGGGEGSGGGLKKQASFRSRYIPVEQFLSKEPDPDANMVCLDSNGDIRSAFRKLECDGFHYNYQCNNPQYYYRYYDADEEFLEDVIEILDCEEFPLIRPDGADAEEVQMAGGEGSGGGLKRKKRRRL